MVRNKPLIQKDWIFHCNKWHHPRNIQSFPELYNSRCLDNRKGCLDRNCYSRKLNLPGTLDLNRIHPLQRHTNIKYEKKLFKVRFCTWRPANSLSVQQSESPRHVWLPISSQQSSCAPNPGLSSVWQLLCPQTKLPLHSSFLSQSPSPMSHYIENDTKHKHLMARFTNGAQRILGVESADELPLDPGSIPGTCWGWLFLLFRASFNHSVVIFFRKHQKNSCLYLQLYWINPSLQKSYGSRGVSENQLFYLLIFLVFC